jgi:hypothetical protein
MAGKSVPAGFGGRVPFFEFDKNVSFCYLMQIETFSAAFSLARRTAGFPAPAAPPGPGHKRPSSMPL